jgi:hypothetical protein
MRKFVRWDDDNAIAYTHMRMRDDVMVPDDVIGLDEVISR